MSDLKDATKNKAFANRGVPRNKKPLKNIVYQIEVSQLKSSLISEEKEKYAQYKYKEEGYLILYWWYESKNPMRNWHGFITPDELKELIGSKQWGKFVNQGKREFVIQRRENGKNIPKK